MSILKVANVQFTTSGSRRIEYYETTDDGVIRIKSDGILLPSGSTATRPTVPENGILRYNTDTADAEITIGNRWLYLTSNTDIETGSITINNISLSGNINPGTVNVASQILTDDATINWNIAQGPVATITLGGNRTIAAPTNLKVGTFVLHVVQDATGGRTLTWNSVFKWPAGIAPTLTSTGSRRDIFSFVCDGTNLYGSFLPDVR